MLVRIKQHPAWKTQLFVTKALLRRELNSRFGKYHLGFLWMLLDPLISVIVLGLILGPLLGRSAGDVPYAFFILCGFMLLKLLTGPMNSGIGAISANKGLLIFRQVQPLDPFISRFIFDLVSTLIAFTIFCGLGSWFGINISPDNLIQLFFAFLLTWLTGSGIGLSFGIICVRNKELEKILKYVQRPIVFISAVLFSLNTIPAQYKSILLWNPLVHTIETSRNCLFPSYVVAEVNLIYPSLWAISSLAIGLMLYRHNRSYLTQR